MVFVILAGTVDYVGRIYRPPSEAKSLLLQVSVGCSHNRCSYCDMYRDKAFRAKPWELIQADILEAKRLGPRFHRVFLCDGDALILGQRRLLQVLEGIREHLPWVDRVGVYGDTRSVGKKSLDELRALREAGLGIVYHGMETGSDEVMRRIDKGATRDECFATADKLRAAQLTHSVMVLLGVGGTDLSQDHARDTASALTRMDPPYVGALTTTVVPGTPLFEAQERGEFVLPGKFGLIEELMTIVSESELSACRFSANHASNYLPLTADLPAQKAALLQALRDILKARDERTLKPEWMRGL
ncbi:MAG: radical SAM protein [Polyangiaceae bacterium]